MAVKKKEILSAMDLPEILAPLGNIEPDYVQDAPPSSPVTGYDAPAEALKVAPPPYIQNSLIACAITMHYGTVSITLEKRIYSEATSLAEQSAEYDKLELQLEKHHSEYRTVHLPKLKRS